MAGDKHVHSMSRQVIKRQEVGQERFYAVNADVGFVVVILFIFFAPLHVSFNASSVSLTHLPLSLSLIPFWSQYFPNTQAN